VLPVLRVFTVVLRKHQHRGYESLVFLHNLSWPVDHRFGLLFELSR